MKKVLLCILVVILVITVALLASIGNVQRMDTPTPAVSGLQMPVIEAAQSVNAVPMAAVAAVFALSVIGATLLIALRSNRYIGALSHVQSHLVTKRMQFRADLHWNTPLIKPI